MHFFLRRLAPSVFLFFAMAVARAADKTPAEASVAEIQKILLETDSKTSQSPKRMTLAKFLKVLENRFPKDKKVSLSLDAAAFGKTLPQIADAEIAVDRLTGGNLSQSLKLAMKQVKGEFEVAVRPGAVTVTLPRLSAYSMTYDIRDLARQEQLLKRLKSESSELYQDVEASDHVAFLARYVANATELQSWETLEAANGARLVVVASLGRQEEIVAVLQALRAYADLAVVMNARLFEVDREFYAKNVAPTLAKEKDAEAPPSVQTIDGPLFKKIAQQKLVATSDFEKIEPGKLTGFLSKQCVFRYDAGPSLESNVEKRGAIRKIIGTGLSGIRFEVLPLISPDRRYLRLEITQKSAQFVGIDKTKVLDMATGKQFEVESPNVRKSSVSGTVQIPDFGAILMLVAYQPPGKDGDDRVWLLLARPFIWIEAEMEERRRGGDDLSPKSFWFDTGIETPKPKFEKRRRAASDEKAVLEAIIEHVLTDPELKSTRERLGTSRDKTFTLVDSSLRWPEGLCPDTHGFKMIEVIHDPFVDQRRVLGIRLDRFDLKQMEVGLLNTPIEICVVNAGGRVNGVANTGVRVHYVPKLVDGRWTVAFHGMQSP